MPNVTLIDRISRLNFTSINEYMVNIRESHSKQYFCKIKKNNFAFEQIKHRIKSQIRSRIKPEIRSQTNLK